MNTEKYCQIISTCETVQIEPDTPAENGSSKNIMIQCRICLEEYGPFIAPCKCDGTMRYVHENCLKKWASERMKKQVQKDEEKAKGKLSNIHGIECELCKQNISMQVRKLKRFVGCNEAKQNSEDYFLPFIPLFILNTTISVGCLVGAFYIIAFSIMLLFQKQSIDYESYNEHPLMIWSLLGLGLVFCAIFTVKSIIELYYMFVKEEHQVIKVIANPIILTTLPKTTQPDCPNTKWFSNLEALATPTSPHSVSDNLLQNKLSITRKNITLKNKIARQIAQRKLAKLKQFKKSPQNSTIQENSVSHTFTKQRESHLNLNH